jgi:hypothetical protein
MNHKILFSLIALTTVSGCAITDQGAYGGDVTFAWTFAGQQCAAVPEVSSVQIIIPGEVIQNNGVFPCLVSNYPGIILQNFAPGDYAFTIEGLSYAGDILYRADGTFTVNGNVSVRVDLLANIGGVSIAWQLINGGVIQSCAQANVSFVNVNFRNAAGQLVYPSGDSEQCGGAPILYNFLLPGRYQIILSATSNDPLPTTYLSDRTNPPTVTIVAGAFVDATSTPVTVAMIAQ